jgi:subtilisin family serine protease
MANLTAIQMAARGVRTFLVAASLVVGIGITDIARAEFLPNDPYFTNPLDHQWYLKKIGMPEAWVASRGTPTVTVAVLDTGVISTTPDLAGRVLAPLTTAYVAPPQPPSPPGTLLPPLTDQQMLTGTSILRHGNWVASVAAMGVDNGIGGAGIGSFTILPIRVTSDAATTNSKSVAEGIRLAADSGARVINISYLLGPSSYGDVNLASQYARSRGALVFMGSGNLDQFITTPDLASVIFVGGTDHNDARWVSGTGDGSSWGSHVDLVAPADDIIVADPTLSTGYGRIDGTSFSTALASGVAALAWSINPTLTPEEVEGMLLNTAVDIGTPGDDVVFGRGRLDAAAVASAALATVPEPASVLLLIAVCAGLLFFRRRRAIPVADAH